MTEKNPNEDTETSSPAIIALEKGIAAGEVQEITGWQMMEHLRTGVLPPKDQDPQFRKSSDTSSLDQPGD